MFEHPGTREQSEKSNHKKKNTEIQHLAGIELQIMDFSVAEKWVISKSTFIHLPKRLVHAKKTI